MKLVLLVIVLLVAFASSYEDTAGLIIGGSDATIEEFPYMAGVNNMGLFNCGGSIISARSVLTAAHCILINSAALISVSVGSSRRRGQGGVTHRAVRVLIHPDYKYFENSEVFIMRADIAVIRTLSQIRFGPTVQTIPLGTGFVPATSQVLLTGWGLTGHSTIRDRADQMQQLMMTTLPNFLCSAMFQGTTAADNVSDEMLCVVGSIIGESRGACTGDSGGPIVLQGEVVGVTSWSLPPCVTFPAVFIRVENHIDWIRQQF